MIAATVTLAAGVLAAASWFLTSVALGFLDLSVLDPLLPVGAVFIALSAAEKAWGRWGGPHL